VVDVSGKEETDLTTIHSKLEEMDNKLERIKSDTHNLNRIATLSNSQIIEQELRKIISNSEVRAAILYLTKDEIGATSLAKMLGIDPGNLATYIKPFLGNKGYISVLQKGRERYYQRSELVDLVGFESISDFAKLIEDWKKERAENKL
jgi:DNA-binding transcriptional ArsR family regulator